MPERFGEDYFEAPTDIWTYRARPDYWSRHDLGVLDGDTYDVILDLGFEVQVPRRIRALHIDTAETFGVRRGSEEWERGMEQTEFVRDWVHDAISYAEAADADGASRKWPILLRTEHESGGFGRWLGEVFNWRGESLEKAVIDEFGEDYLWL
jgi:micrococcal nuclease